MTLICKHNTKTTLNGSYNDTMKKKLKNILQKKTWGHTKEDSESRHINNHCASFLLI